MTIFELVKLALDELYAEAEQTYGSKVDETIQKRIAYLSASYGRLATTDRKPVDYKDPATRFSYVFKYVAAHGDYLVQGLKMLRKELGGNIFGGGNARVSCVGGGPGSDIIAVLKYLDEHKKQEGVDKITCYLLDKEQAWADTWTELDASLRIKIQLNANFQRLDVADPASWKYQRKFLQADLFTLSYFVSEVYSLDADGSERVTAFWQELFGNAKRGAIFVYTDNGSDRFNSYFRHQCEAAKLEQVMCRDNIEIIPSYTEQKSELAKYSHKFDHDPKLKSTMTFRVLRKH
jgi:hypothetical protein